MVAGVAILNIALLLTVAMLIYRKQETLRKLFWPALAARALGGISLGLVYKYYYDVADTFAYFEDGGRLRALAGDDFYAYLRLMLFSENIESTGLVLTEPRALFLSKITSIFNIITFDNYWLTVLYFSFISFLGAWCLVKAISRYFPKVQNAAVIGFLFLPSVVFWSGGLLKEAPAMGALWFLSAMFLKAWFRDKGTCWQWVLVFFALWIFWNLKYYYAGVFIAVVSTTLLFRWIVGRRYDLPAVGESLIWAAMFIVPVVLVTLLHPNFHYDRLLQVVVDNNAVYSQLSSPGDYIHFDGLAPTPGSLLLNSPWALISGLFRPLIWEASELIQFFPAVENTLLLLFFAAAIWRPKISSRHRLLVFSLIVFVMVSAVLIAISAPNFGTLSRYKTGYFSFFTFLILCNNTVLHSVERSFSRLVRQKPAA